jgi:prepilin-type N-terminal cleavage/methylation domain-containing protein
MANISFRSLGGRRPTQGFTLTEIAIVLGIVGIIIGAIWVAAAMLYENNRTNEASTEVLTIVNNWRSIYGGKRMDIPDWTDVTPVTINNGFMPQEMVVPGVNTYSLGPWTSSTAHVFSSQTYNGIIVGYFHLTVSACNHLANAVAGQNRQPRRDERTRKGAAAWRRGRANIRV